MMTTTRLRTRLLAALAASGTVTALIGFSGCSSSGGGGAGGSCHTDEIGTCCDYNHCYTLAELAEYTGGVAPTSCPKWDDLEPQSFCEWFTAGPTMMDGKCCYDEGGGDCCGRP